MDIGQVDYQKLTFESKRPADQDAAEPVRHPVVVVGAGPVGLAAAIDLAQHGIAVVLLDDDDRLSTGSRAICFAKRTLEIFDRLGCGEPMVAKGRRLEHRPRVPARRARSTVSTCWPEAGHHRPAFINLQQYYVEGYLLDRAQALPNLEIRWKNRVAGVSAGRGRRHARRSRRRTASIGCAATIWSPPTARAARSARRSGMRAGARLSATGS